LEQFLACGDEKDDGGIYHTSPGKLETTLSAISVLPEEGKKHNKPHFYSKTNITPTEEQII
jgi:hypothetical protein